jgi:hypothetical protein
MAMRTSAAPTWKRKGFSPSWGLVAEVRSFRVEGAGFSVENLDLRLQGLEGTIYDYSYGLRFMVYGLWFMVLSKFDLLGGREKDLEDEITDPMSFASF